MPCRNKLEFECNYCGTKLLAGQTPLDVQKLKGWWTVANAMDRQPSPEHGDPSKWYDSLDCLTKDMKRIGESLQMEKKLEEAVGTHS